MLSLCERDGKVFSSLPGLAGLARVSREEIEDAINYLSSPDPDSNTPDFEGRRIEKIEDGWIILNYAKFRSKAAKLSHDAAAAERMKNHRDVVNRVSPRKPSVSPEANVKANAGSQDIAAKPKKPRPAPTTEHQKLIQYFTDRWQKKYNSPYAFSAKDAAHIKWILLTVFQDVVVASKIIDVYFADNDRFIADHCHPLGLLRSNFNKYKVLSTNGHQNNGARVGGALERGEI